jgi:tetratricopeptide (TPR) repeat protein
MPAQLWPGEEPQGQDLRIDLDEIMAANEASDYKRALSLAADLGEKAGQQGARYLVSKSLQFRCAALRNLGDAKAAIQMCREGHDISAAIGDRAGQAAAINTIANALYDLGDLAGARKMYDQAGAIYRAIGSKAGVAAATDKLLKRDQRPGRFENRPEDVGRSACSIP